MFVSGIADRPLPAGERDQDFARRASDPIGIRISASKKLVDFIIWFEFRQGVISS